MNLCLGLCEDIVLLCGICYVRIVFLINNTGFFGLFEIFYWIVFRGICGEDLIIGIV